MKIVAYLSSFHVYSSNILTLFFFLSLCLNMVSLFVSFIYLFIRITLYKYVVCMKVSLCVRHSGVKTKKIRSKSIDSLYVFFSLPIIICCECGRNENTGHSKICYCIGSFLFLFSFSHGIYILQK